MQITLSIDRIIKDIRTKSHLEVSSIADPSARYKVEAGTEKLSEIKRDIAGAVSSLVNECYRFLDMPGIDEEDDSISGADIVLGVSAGLRRLDGKEKAVTQKIHEAVVNFALQKFYTSVSQMDLSSVHQAQARADIEELERMLRRKRPPKYIDR